MIFVWKCSVVEEKNVWKNYSGKYVGGSGESYFLFERIFTLETPGSIREIVTVAQKHTLEYDIDTIHKELCKNK